MKQLIRSAHVLGPAACEDISAPDIDIGNSAGSTTSNRARHGVEAATAEGVTEEEMCTQYIPTDALSYNALLFKWRKGEERRKNSPNSGPAPQPLPSVHWQRQGSSKLTWLTSEMRTTHRMYPYLPLHVPSTWGA